MIIVFKPQASDEQIQHVIERVERLGLRAHLSRGTFRTIIGVIGDESLLQGTPLEAAAGVERVVPILPPYKLASIEAHPEPSVVDVAGVKIGGSHLALIAGPCAVESYEQMDRIAAAVRAAGANVLRGGAFKPRTSPYAFQGLGVEGLKILAKARQQTGVAVVTEVMDTEHVPLVEEYADVIQIGARNMQNFALLKRVGRCRKPVLLKRGLSATLEEWLMAAEYVMSGGNYQVILCERGVRTFSDHSRNTLDLGVIPPAKALTHLPIFVDPSHGTGKRAYVPAMALAALAAGADGLLIEAHPEPDKALSDGPQSLDLPELGRLVDRLRTLAPAFDRTM